MNRSLAFLQKEKVKALEKRIKELEKTVDSYREVICYLIRESDNLSIKESKSGN